MHILCLLLVRFHVTVNGIWCNCSKPKKYLWQAYFYTHNIHQLFITMHKTVLFASLAAINSIRNLTRDQSNLTNGLIAVCTDPANVHYMKMFNLNTVKIYVTSASLISAVAQWCHPSPLFTCSDLRNLSFHTVFYLNADVNLQTNYTCILLRPNATCRYVCCIVHTAVFRAHWCDASLMGEQPAKIAPSYGGIGALMVPWPH